MVTTADLEKRISRLGKKLSEAVQAPQESLPPGRKRQIHKSLKRSQRKLRKFKIAEEKASGKKKKKESK